MTSINPGTFQVYTITAGCQTYNLPYLSSSVLGTSPTGVSSFPITNPWNYVPREQLGQVGVMFFEKLLQDYLDKKLCFKDLQNVLTAYLNAPFILPSYVPHYYSTGPVLPQGMSSTAASYAKSYKVCHEVILDYLVQIRTVDYNTTFLTGGVPFGSALATIRQVAFYTGTLVTFKKRILSLQSVSADHKQEHVTTLSGGAGALSDYYLTKLDDPKLLNKVIVDEKCCKSIDSILFHIVTIFATASAVINNGFDRDTAKTIIDKEIAVLCPGSSVTSVYPNGDNLVVFVGYVCDKLVAFAVKPVYLPISVTSLETGFFSVIVPPFYFPSLAAGPFNIIPLLEYVICPCKPSLEPLAIDPPTAEVVVIVNNP